MLVPTKQMLFLTISNENFFFQNFGQYIYIGDLPKRWGLGQFPNLRGGGGGLAKKRGGGVFDGGRGDTLMHTMN